MQLPPWSRRNILVLGAGELGMPVLRSLARRAKAVDETTLLACCYAPAPSPTADQKRDISEIRDLGIEVVVGDLVKSSVDELASVFEQYDTVIGCAGYAAGINTPMKLAKAALQSGIRAISVAVRRRF